MDPGPIQILLIEGNDRDTRLIREALAAYPNEIDVHPGVRTLEAARSAMRDGRYDAILLDLEIPDIQGLETLRSLRSSAGDTPIIVLTGSDDDDQASAALRAGAQDYLPKEFIAGSLLRRLIRYAIERGRVRRELRVSEQRFRDMVEFLPELVFECDSAGRVTFVNRAAYEIIGYSEEDIERGLNVFDVIAEPERTRAEGVVKQILEGSKPRSGEYRIVRKDGTTFPVVIHVTRIQANGENVGIRGIAVDLSEMKQSAEALKTADEIIRAVPTGILIYRKQERTFILESANPAASPYILVENALGTELPAHWPPGMAQRLHGAMAAVLTAGGLYEHEVSMNPGSGTRAFHVRAFPISAARVAVIFEDVSEQRGVEGFLELVRYSLDRAEVEVFWIDSSGRFTFVNETVIRRLGYSREDLIGKAVWDIDPEYCESRWTEQWGELKTHGTKRFETTHQRRDGSTYPVEITSHYLTFEGEAFEFAFAVDISERKAAETALRESEANYRAIFDCASDSIMLHDAVDGRVLDCNAKTEEMFGYSREQFVGLQVSRFSSGNPPYVQEEALRRILAAAAGVPQLFEWHCRRRDQGLFWCEVSLRQATLLGRSVVLAVVRDVSDRRSLEAQLRQSQKLESIGTLASGVAHEINNPLMGMINYAELITLNTEDEELTGYAEEIKAEGTRVAEIVRNLLSFARQERETHSPARLIDIVDWTLSLTQSVLRQDLIDLRIEVPRDLPKVKCRSQQIQQVLLNLLTNARDALNERYPGADPDKIIVVSGAAVEDSGRRWVRLTVEDHGVGIPSEIADRLFDPFFTTKPRDEGTGLGLSISYGIVREHGGRLTVETTPEGTTRFHVVLPTVD